MAHQDDGSDPRQSAVTYWIMGLLALGGAGWLGWMLGRPLVFDVNDPDFNPMLLMALAAAVYGLWNLAMGVRRTIQGRRFGTTRIEIDGPVPVTLGQVFSGRLRSERPLSPKGDYRIALICEDIHRLSSASGSATSDRHEAFAVWRKDLSLPATTDATAGLPFRFRLPASVGVKPDPSLIRPGGSGFRFKATITVPGYRKVIAHDAPPSARRWRLTVSAPMQGTDFQAEFIVPLAEI